MDAHSSVAGPWFDGERVRYPSGMFDTTTLPGWPAVYDPTVLEMLLVTLFIPLGIATLFALLVFAPAWGRKQQD